MNLKTPFMLAILALAMSLVAASVFTYYPITLAVQPTGMKVVFDLGSNANQPDVSGNIQVSVGQNNTSVQIIIHPTYQVTYYKNITLIKNTDMKGYNVYLVVDDFSKSLPANSKVVLYVYNLGAARNLQGWSASNLAPVSGYVRSIDLSSPTSDQVIHIGTLNSGGVWEIDILVYIPEGTTIDGASATFNMYLVASPSSETPP